MVNINLLNQTFSQQRDSCVLSSYGVVTNYFRNHISIPTVFEEYCDYFKIPFKFPLDAEISSANHLNKYCQYILKWQGYQLIDYLHNHSNHHFFNINRNFFEAWIYSLTPLTQDQYDRLIDYLRGIESLVNFTMDMGGGLYHSQTFGINMDGNLFVHNTAANIGTPKITGYAAIDPGSIRECIVYKRT